jgi:hypothetical protein
MAAACASSATLIAREVIRPFDLPGAQLDAVGGGVPWTRVTRLVPGIGAMSSPCASSQASVTCADCGARFDGDGLDLVDSTPWQSNFHKKGFHIYFI